MLLMLNTGRPEIVFGNTTQNGEWAFGGGSNFIMKVGDIGTDTSSKTKHFDLNGSTGNLTIVNKYKASRECVVSLLKAGADLDLTDNMGVSARMWLDDTRWEKNKMLN